MRYQPQGIVRLDRAGLGSQLIVAFLPGMVIKNLVKPDSPITVTPAPTGRQVDIAPYGFIAKQNKNGGVNGFGSFQFGAETALAVDTDWTIIWAGTIQNLSSTDGILFTRGADGSGNGWNLNLVGLSSTTVQATAIDSSPAGFTAQLTNLSLVVGRHERFALVKRGTTLSVYDWRTRQVNSVSAGNGALRTSSVGIGLGRDQNNAVCSAQDINSFLAFRAGYTADTVWRLLDNPWQVFVSPDDDEFAAATGGTDTPINPAVGALTLTGYGPTIAQTANQALTLGAGTLALTGYAPSVAQSSAAAISPNAGAITITGFAPTISQPKNITAGVGSMSITGFAPTIAQVTTTSINPSAGAITVTGYAPTLARTANISISPLTGAITLSGYAPTVFRQSPTLVTPGYGSITFTGYSPTIFQGLPNLYPVFNRTILMRANPADNQAAKTATQVYNVNGSTQFQLYVIRPDGTEFTSYPSLGVVDLTTVDQGIFAAGKYSVYTFSSGDLSLPGEYLMRHAYQDTLGQTISQVHTFTITTQ